MKYVIFSNSSARLAPVILPEAMSHRSAKALLIVSDNFMDDWKPYSAGFFKVVEHDDQFKWAVEVYGESETLKLKPLPDDELIIATVLAGAKDYAV